MKYFVSIGILQLIAAVVTGQTSVTPTINPDRLEQYMWSFANNSAKSGGKALMDFDAFDQLRGLGDELSVSDDGNYFAYTINKTVFNDFKFGLFKLDSLVIQSTKNAERTVFAGTQPGSFTADSKQYIFRNKEDLSFLQIGRAEVRKIEGVASHKISQGKWLAYQLKGKENFTLQDLVTGKEKQFPAVTEYNFTSKGEWLIYQTKDKELSLYNLNTGKERKFSAVEMYTLAENEKSLLFKTARDKNNAVNIVSVPQGVVQSIEINAASGFTVADVSFVGDGQYLQLSLQAAAETPGQPNPDMAGLEVWNHKDLYLQTAQPDQVVYRAIYDISTRKLVVSESDDKKITQVHGDFALVKKDYREAHGDRFWEITNKSRKDSMWLINLLNGHSVLLPGNVLKLWFSRAGKYLVYFDADKGCHYFSYDLQTGTIKNISPNVPDYRLGLTDISGLNEKKPNYGNLAAWIEKDAGVLVYDNYDIWKLDLSGKQPALNLTNGFGKRNHTVFSMFSTDRYAGEIPLVKNNETLVLRAFNIANKQNGFYHTSVSRAGAPQLLSMGKWFITAISGIQGPNVSNSGMLPMKARNSNTWIVQRQSVNDAPNYYETSDFKNFKRLTNYQAHKDYQWLTEELYSFKHLDGKTGQGILFKPEDFDPTKKYPVVIAVYENFSDNLHQFHFPTYLDQAMATGKSPLWLLNNGYLVFAPDIAVTPLKYGPRAYSVVEGAAQYLKQLSYVDGKKLGCGSHSWSAQLGAYVFTHSTSIAATAITEGMAYANPLNYAFSPNDKGDKLDEVENGREYGNLWENKESWLDQAAVLNVDKATSPLLLLCNKESSTDYLDQTFQFFNAMRRLEKNVWWLKYDKGSHTLSDQKELRDYTIRYTQFLDHYLKNAPAPQWMTQGVPATLKGIESRYQLDAAGTCGKACEICMAWNQQYRRTPILFEKEIVDWTLDKDIAEELERKQKEKGKDLGIEGDARTRDVLQKLKK